MRFKGREYTLTEEIPTQICVDYVPDWDIGSAIRESIQNMVDERTQAGCAVSWKGKGDVAYFYDSGRGVAFEDILLLGVSGKRGEAGLIGQHGEGEVVSFMVAAREGYEKTMASQNWMVTGHIVRMGEHKILVLNVYHTTNGSHRKGTAWEYVGHEAWGHFKEERRKFERAVKRTRRVSRIETKEEGQMYTCGLKINIISNLALGYDLDITPGRDRNGFNWEIAAPHIQRTIETEANAEHFERIFAYRMRHFWSVNPKELDMDLELTPRLEKEARLGLKRAVSGSYHKGVCWAGQGTDPGVIADASGDDWIVMRYDEVPRWIRAVVPSASRVVSEKVQETKKLPATLGRMVEGIRTLMPKEYQEWDCRCVWKFDDSTTLGAGAPKTVILSRQVCKRSTFAEIVGIICHEVAHAVGNTRDCTRRHENEMEKVLSETMVNAVKRADVFLSAEKEFVKYQG